MVRINLSHAGVKGAGFTLIELLVVMAVIGVLLTVALPRYYGSVETSRETVLRENLWVIRKTIDSFYADKGRYPENLEELVSTKYLRTVPRDPITESASTWIPVPPLDGTRLGVADVRSGARGKSKDGTAYEEL